MDPLVLMLFTNLFILFILWALDRDSKKQEILRINRIRNLYTEDNSKNEEMSKKKRSRMNVNSYTTPKVVVKSEPYIQEPEQEEKEEEESTGVGSFIGGALVGAALEALIDTDSSSSTDTSSDTNFGGGDIGGAGAGGDW